jgi:hypothetical protein
MSLDFKSSNFFLVEIHVGDVLVPIVFCESLIDHLVVVVNEVNISKDFVNILLRADNVLVDRYRSAEVDARLHQVISAEVVASVRSLVIAAEGTFHCINARVLVVLVKQSYSCSRLLRFLVPEPRVWVDKEGI